MNELDAFIRAICEEPEDIMRRLVFADWLEERGETERAEFIRVQCELADLELVKDIKEPCTARDELRCREQELLKDHAIWGEPLGKIFHPDNPLPSVDYGHSGCVHPQNHPKVIWLWRRGFIAEVHCRLEDWVGGVCGNCNALGRLEGDWFETPRGPTKRVNIPCSFCSGTGRIEGHGPAIVAAQPVTRLNFDLRVGDGVPAILNSYTPTPGEFWENESAGIAGLNWARQQVIPPLPALAAAPA